MTKTSQATAMRKTAMRNVPRPHSASSGPASQPAGHDAHGAHHAPRLIGLELVRALAILGVLFYHLNLTGFFNAGFLGVDVFFNLSGFLITALLLREFHARGSVAVGSFYARRFKRLFPASMVMVLACVLLAPVFAPDAWQKLCKDLPAALLYASNWWQIYAKQSYFEAFGHPPLLQHLWSLAVEEQFYLVWPVTLLVVLRLAGVRALGLLCLALALLGTGWMAHVYDANAESGDPSRAYLGSDTHAMGLFLGAALACFWNPWGARSPALVAWVARWRVALALPSLGALGYMLVAWNEAMPLLFHGGFLWVGVCTLVLVVALTDITPASFGNSVVSQLPLACLRWLGTRSYSVYLWHWPVFVVLKMGPDVSGQTIALGLLLTAVCAELSYRLVERPFQQLQFNKLASAWPLGTAAATLAGLALVSVLLAQPLQVAFDALSGSNSTAAVTGQQQGPNAPAGNADSAAVTNTGSNTGTAANTATLTDGPAVVAGPTTGGPTPEAPASGAATSATSAAASGTAPVDTPTQGTPTASTASALPDAASTPFDPIGDLIAAKTAGRTLPPLAGQTLPPASATASASTTAPATPSAQMANGTTPADQGSAPAVPKKIIAVGDSVLLGASDSLVRQMPEVVVDAVKGRQANQGLQVVHQLRQNNAKADYAVIHLGTNGYIVESQFTQLLSALADLRHVTVINVHANRRWMEPNNELIARVTQKFPNVRVVDWHAIGKDNPGYFVADGIHLTGQGIMALVKEISKDTGVPLHQLATGKRTQGTPATRKGADDAKATTAPVADSNNSGISVVSAPMGLRETGVAKSPKSE